MNSNHFLVFLLASLGALGWISAWNWVLSGLRAEVSSWALEADDLTRWRVGTLVACGWLSFAESASVTTWAGDTWLVAKLVGLSVSVLASWAVSASDGAGGAEVAIWASLALGLSHLVLVLTLLTLSHGEKWEVGVVRARESDGAGITVGLSSGKRDVTGGADSLRALSSWAVPALSADCAFTRSSWCVSSWSTWMSNCGSFWASEAIEAALASSFLS